ncbi:CoA-dependent acyltransferase, partial [Aspergillus indologenus CBS 114.80]
MEQRLRDWWAETLAIAPDTIGREDDFFQVGGDSVAAMRMVALSEAREHHLTVADIFQHPILSDLARALERRAMENTEKHTEEADPEPFALWQLPEDTESHLCAFQQRLARVAQQCDVAVEDIEDIYPCTSIQEGLIAITAHQPTAYVSRQVYRLGSSIDVDRFQAAWHTLATVTPILRTRILVDPEEASQGGSLQVVIRGPLVWHHSTDLDQYVAADEAQGIQLGQPLVRFALIQHPNERFLVWTAHHSVYDGWSAAL